MSEEFLTMRSEELACRGFYRPELHRNHSMVSGNWRDFALVSLGLWSKPLSLHAPQVRALNPHCLKLFRLKAFCLKLFASNQKRSF